MTDILSREFYPFPWIKSGMAQTIASAYWPRLPDQKNFVSHDIDLQDGDYLRVVENRPSSWKPGDRIVVLVHGLSGNHQSNYMIRMARKLTQNGMMVLRVNLRGCGIGFGLARQPYHSGRSEDLRSVLRWAREKYPASPVTQAGFSLGANITLKMAGEDGARSTGNLDSVVAVSPPFELIQAVENLKKTKHRVFDQFFVRKLKNEISRLHRHFPDLEPIQFPKKMCLADFDEIYTAPRSGFIDAKDYYTRSSCGQFVPTIQVPSLILCAQDDPITDSKSFADLRLPSSVHLVLTQYGGHVGFLGRTEQILDFQWMDSVVLRWILKQDEKS